MVSFNPSNNYQSNNTANSNPTVSLLNTQMDIKKDNQVINTTNSKITELSQQIFKEENFNAKSQLSEDDSFLLENSDNILDENMLKTNDDDVTFRISLENDDSQIPASTVSNASNLPTSTVSNTSNLPTNNPTNTNNLNKVNSNVSSSNSDSTLVGTILSDSTLLNTIHSITIGDKSKLKSTPDFRDIFEAPTTFNTSNLPNINHINATNLITAKINSNVSSSNSDSTLLSTIHSIAIGDKSKLKSTPDFFDISANDLLTFLNGLIASDPTSKQALDDFKQGIEGQTSIFFNSNKVVLNSSNHKNVFMSRTNENKEETLKLEKLGYKIHYLNDDALEFLISALRSCKVFMDKKSDLEKKEKTNHERVPNKQPLPVDTNLKTKNKREKNENKDETDRVSYKTLDLTIEIAEEDVRINNEKKRKAWEKRIEDGLVEDRHDHDQDKVEHRIIDKKDQLDNENRQENQLRQNLAENENKKEK